MPTETKVRDERQIKAEEDCVRFIDLMRTGGKPGRLITMVADSYRFWTSEDCVSTQPFPEYLAGEAKQWQDMYEAGVKTDRGLHFPEKLAEKWLPESLQGSQRISHIFGIVAGTAQESLSRNKVLKHIQKSTATIKNLLDHIRK